MEVSVKNLVDLVAKRGMPVHITDAANFLEVGFPTLCDLVDESNGAIKLTIIDSLSYVTISPVTAAKWRKGFYGNN